MATPPYQCLWIRRQHRRRTAGGRSTGAAVAANLQFVHHFLRQSWRTARANGICGWTETRIEIVTKPSMFPIVVALVPLLVFALAGKAAAAEDVNVQLDQAKILRLPDSAL